MNFYNFFLLFWVIFALLDPDRNPAVSDADWSWIPLGLLMPEGKNQK
jgi:hypothetical protein